MSGLPLKVLGNPGPVTAPLWALTTSFLKRELRRYREQACGFQGDGRLGEERTEFGISRGQLLCVDG